MKYETFINEYWAYENEPFDLIRFDYNGTRNLVGKGIRESPGIDKLRREKGYSKPTDEIIEIVKNILESKNEN